MGQQVCAPRGRSLWQETNLLFPGDCFAERAVLELRKTGRISSRLGQMMPELNVLKGLSIQTHPSAKWSSFSLVTEQMSLFDSAQL